VLVGLAAVFVPPALASTTQALMPGVTYTRQVQFTSHGPVVLNILVGPKPGGLFALRPILAGGTITGRARVTSMEKALSPTATIAGVNGDLFNWNDGHPTGIVMDDNVIKSPPYRTRSSIGISSTGTLSVARVALYGYWHCCLHARVGREDAGASRRGRGRARAVPARDDRRRARRHGDGAVDRRRHADPA
jgi:hypothetical protein